MVNHLRTLLLNMPADAIAGLHVFGEEYVPPGYRPRRVPAPLRAVRNVLFPPDGDLTMMQVRLRQYLALLHAGELGDHVLRLDPRITYLPLDVDEPEQLLPQIVVRRLNAQARGFQLGAPSTALTGAVRLHHQWTIESVNEHNAIVRAYNDARQLVTESEVACSFSGGWSGPVPLPPFFAGTLLEPASGARWQVEVTALPATSLPAVVAALEKRLDEPTLDFLFGGRGSADEPYRTCRRLWEETDLFPSRLGAVVLALGYRMNESRE